ncbi:MAG: LAGLIDADG family homing endonuclease [Candidatus Paceibacterota bacterium]
MPWNKGLTKETHPSVKKISETFKRKKINNFKKWADKMKAAGKIKSNYPDFKKDKYLAELVGVVLGDGHIGKFPRTERLIISCNSKNKGFINRYGGIIEKIFSKKPTYMKVKNSNCVKISVYEKFVSKRLGIPSGNRAKLNFKLPKWICENNDYLVSFLRGLYEAEGSFCVHLPTSTYKIFFSNKNTSLLNIVYASLKKLGFKPNKSRYKIQISRKKEVYEFKNLINFRNYNNL